MATLIALEAVAIILLGVLVVGLLRSHAEILRKLHELGADLSPDAAAATSVPVGAPRVQRTSATGFDVVGTTPTDEPVKVGVVGAKQSTLLAFLSSGCLTCANFWNAFRGGQKLSVPGGARLVVVTKDPTEESPARIRELAPSDVPVVMSSGAWKDYQVPLAPYFIYVDGHTGQVSGEGVAQNWDQVVSLWSQALEDAGRPRSAGRGESGTGNGRRGPGGTRVTPGGLRDVGPEAESRADRELREAGIHPGHPSLYPTAQSETPQAGPDVRDPEGPS